MAGDVTQDECRDSMTRIHERVDKIEGATVRIETAAKIMSDCVCKMEKVMFGDSSSDGIITKVSNLKQKVDGVYWFGSVVVIALIGTLVAVLFKK